MSKNQPSKSEERRIEIQKNQSAEEKVILTAVENTQLADGTFIAQGEKVEVTKEYAERVKRENNKSFK